jgi:hypothetical protein
LKRRNPKQKSNARDFGLNCLHVNDDNAIPFWDLTRTRLIRRERKIGASSPEKREHYCWGRRRMDDTRLLWPLEKRKGKIECRKRRKKKRKGLEQNRFIIRAK